MQQANENYYINVSGDITDAVLPLSFFTFVFAAKKFIARIAYFSSNLLKSNYSQVYVFTLLLKNVLDLPVQLSQQVGPVNSHGQTHCPVEVSHTPPL